MPIKSSGQLSLPIDYLVEVDRNFEKGGRSFYFFDFDDNVIHLSTQIVLFEKTTRREVSVSTADFALVRSLVGKPGTEWENFELSFDDMGSFRNFREMRGEFLKDRPQPLIADMLAALQNPFMEWRGPSWEFFVHAVNNNRPIAIITARGHHPHTIRRAINILVESRDLMASPNYLSVYPVSHPETRKRLGDAEYAWDTTQLKKEAIKAAIRDAFECYGENPHHRFGMSDDDPENVAVIREAMMEIKKEFPENAFFVFNTHGRKLVRDEILTEGSRTDDLTPNQVPLFDSEGNNKP